ncbi:MAG TPA: helix-turn-helix domain-containing protein [Candidatus Limnocylindria bacterium]|nr:helix-turn-helix domain-containing protein [Candidatus Limnocylindria bacterium]
MQEVKREAIIRRILAGKLDVTEAALLLGLSERQIWRLKSRFLAGPGGLAHGNRGHAPVNRIDPTRAARIVSLAKGAYVGINDSQVTDLLTSREAFSDPMRRHDEQRRLGNTITPAPRQGALRGNEERRRRDRRAFHRPATCHSGD